MTRRLAAAPLALCLALAACGGGDEEEAGNAAPSAGTCPEGSVVIAMRDIEFIPENATAQVGDTVCWPNEDDIQHNAVAEDGSFESPLYPGGQIFTATMEEAGTIEYVCTIHPGMDGTIEVTARR